MTLEACEGVDKCHMHSLSAIQAQIELLLLEVGHVQLTPKLLTIIVRVIILHLGQEGTRGLLWPLDDSRVSSAE